MKETLSRSRTAMKTAETEAKLLKVIKFFEKIFLETVQFHAKFKDF